jgi:uncharacterized membrane protein
MSILQQLVTVLEPWKTFWADHEAVSTAVTATHIAAIVVGGGLAIAADRMTLRMRNRDNAQRLAHAREIKDVHRPVIAALSLVVISGLLMAASDIEEFFENPVFWIKMGLIVVLLINGLMLQKSENAILENDGAMTDTLWGRLSMFSRVSMTLWVVITVAGVVLAS